MHKHANILLARGKRTRTGTQFAPFHIFLFQKISAILVIHGGHHQIFQEGGKRREEQLKLSKENT